jgi:hypothetical protein
LQDVPRDQWPLRTPPGLTRALRSREFLVQQCELPGEPIRLSINRSSIGDDGRWKDGITWDQIQRLKREAGFGDRFAIEIFPAEIDLVDIANVRHIWVLDEAPAFAWRRRS